MDRTSVTDVFRHYTPVFVTTTDEIVISESGMIQWRYKCSLCARAQAIPVAALAKHVIDIIC